MSKQKKDKFVQSCRVKDKFKQPKQGDDCVVGTLTSLRKDGFDVLMDDGTIVSGTLDQLEAVFEILPKDH